MNRPPEMLAAQQCDASARRSRDGQVGMLIGEHLKTLRNHAGLSLERLSKLAGVSRGMLSQIELGRSIPTITVLSKIAAAFELPIAAFLAPQASSARVQVQRLAETQLLKSADGKFVSRALFPFVGPRRAEFYELTLLPACGRQSAAHGRGTTENLVVARGKIEVEVVGSARHQLGAGDSIHFAADVPHCYRNCGTEEAVAYLVMIYSQPVNY